MDDNGDIYDCTDNTLERFFDYLIEEKLNELRSKNR